MNFILEGGPIFMVPLVLLLIVIVYLFVKGLKDNTEKNQKLINSLALFSFVFGVLGFVIGLLGALEDISNATDKGIEMWGQVSCRPLSMEFTMKSPYLFEGINSWRPAMECGSLELYEKVLADNNFRKTLLNEIENDAQVRLFNGDWDKIIVREVNNKKYEKLEGRSIKDIALAANVKPLDWLLDHSLSVNGMDTLFIAMLLNSDEKAVGKLLKHPRSNIALSDAGAHLTFFNDG